MKFLKEKHIKILFIIGLFLLSFYWSCNQPFGGTPDEAMKMDVCKYIVEHNSLPHGGDEEIRDSIWGISYAFTPIFSYIISSVFMKIAMCFTTDGFAILVAARFTSVLCYIGTVIMVMKIAEKLFSGIYKWLFIILISCLPQFVFLGTYVNNDSLALFSVSIIIYSWIIGIQDKWNIKSCIIMALGIGICALSYYNAYGYILMSIILYVVSNLMEYGNKIDVKDFLKKGFLIFIIAFLIAGWWFIRSFIIYDGDFLGLNTSNEYAEKYALEQYKPSKINVPAKYNTSLPYMLIKMGWGLITYKSFIGVFGNMDIYMSNYYYIATFILFIIAAYGVIKYLIDVIKKETDIKKKKYKLLWISCLVLSIIIPICLSLYYSYYNDFQPQGRYIMSMIIPFMYLVVIGLQTINKKIKEKYSYYNKLEKFLIIILSLIWILVPIIILLGLIIPTYS